MILLKTQIINSLTMACLQLFVLLVYFIFADIDNTVLDSFYEIFNYLSSIYGILFIVVLAILI